nr:putative arabinan endo-1,5-alpha-l-arabinosidase a [Quercus suber]
MWSRSPRSIPPPSVCPARQRFAAIEDHCLLIESMISEINFEATICTIPLLGIPDLKYRIHVRPAASKVELKRQPKILWLILERLDVHSQEPLHSGVSAISAMIASILSALLVQSSIISASPLHRRDTPGAGACSGDCAGYVHDPSVVYNGQGTYYRFTTNNEITISTASAISGPWTNQGAALPGGSSIDKAGNTDLWVSAASNVHQDIVANETSPGP